MVSVATQTADTKRGQTNEQVAGLLEVFGIVSAVFGSFDGRRLGRKAPSCGIGDCYGLPECRLRRLNSLTEAIGFHRVAVLEFESSG